MAYYDLKSIKIQHINKIMCYNENYSKGVIYLDFKDGLNLNKKYNLLNLEKHIPKQDLYCQLSQYKKDNEATKISELKEYIEDLVIPNMVQRTKSLKRNMSFILPKSFNYSCNKNYILSYFKNEGIFTVITGDKVFLDWSDNSQKESNSDKTLYHVLDKEYSNSISKTEQDINLEIREYIDTILMPKMKECIEKEKEYIIVSLPKRFRKTLYKKALIESLKKENIYSTIEKINKLKIVVYKPYDSIIADGSFGFKNGENCSPLTSCDVVKSIKQPFDAWDFSDRIMLFFLKTIASVIILGFLSGIELTNTYVTYNIFCMVCAIMLRDILRVIIYKVKYKKSLELLNIFSRSGDLYILDEWNVFCRKLLYIHIVAVMLMPMLMLLKTDFLTLIVYIACVIILPTCVNIAMADTTSADYNLI